MKTAALAIVLALGAGMAACSQPTRQPTASTARVPSSIDNGCPLAQLPGVHASVADIRDGAAITFTAPQSEVDQLRQGVRALSESNDKRGSPFSICPCALGTVGATEPMPNDSARGGVGISTRAPAPANIPADATVDDIATGAVLKLSAKDAGQVQALREQTRTAVGSMQSNGCIGQG